MRVRVSVVCVRTRGAVCRTNQCVCVCVARFVTNKNKVICFTNQFALVVRYVKHHSFE